MDADQQHAVLTLCLMAAIADGDQRRRGARGDSSASPTRSARDAALDAAAVYQDVLFGKPDLAEVAAALTTPEQKQARTRWPSACAMPTA